MKGCFSKVLGPREPGSAPRAARTQCWKRASGVTLTRDVRPRGAQAARTQRGRRARRHTLMMELRYGTPGGTKAKLS